MNVKTRKVIEDLLAAVRLYRVPNTCAREIEAAEKLLKPPVRFAWVKIGDAHKGWSYRATVGDYHYHVEQNQDKGVKGWSCWVCSSRLPVRDIGIPLHYQGVVHPTLVLAKQHCVDYGVARTEQRRAQNKAAQIHTDPHIRKALTVTNPAPLTVKYEGAIPETLKSWCDKHPERVEEVNRDDDGLWVYLREPWWSPNMESYTIHEDSARDCLAELRCIEIKTKKAPQS